MEITELHCEVRVLLVAGVRLSWEGGQNYFGNMFEIMQFEQLSQLELITNCTMDWTMKESVDTAMRIETKALKNCTKEMVVEYHNKTIYDCQNVTKRHCTTLWTINEQGQKVW